MSVIAKAWTMMRIVVMTPAITEATINPLVALAYFSSRGSNGLIPLERMASPRDSPAILRQDLVSHLR